MSILGPLSENVISLFHWNNEFKNLRLPHPIEFQTLEKRYKGLAGKKLLDLIKKLLETDESKWITADEALNHPVFSDC